MKLDIKWDFSNKLDNLLNTCLLSTGRLFHWYMLEKCSFAPTSSFASNNTDILLCYAVNYTHWLFCILFLFKVTNNDFIITVTYPNLCLVCGKPIQSTKDPWRSLSP